jgi:hypothetical protein
MKKAIIRLRRVIVVLTVFINTNVLAGTNSSGCEVDYIQVENDKILLTCKAQNSGTCGLNVYQYTNESFDSSFRNSVLSIVLTAKATSKTINISGWSSSDGQQCRIDKVRLN